VFQAQLEHRIFLQGYQNTLENQVIHWNKPECSDDSDLDNTNHHLALNAASEGGKIKVVPL